MTNLGKNFRGLVPDCSLVTGTTDAAHFLLQRDHMDSVMRQFNMAATKPATSLQFSNQSDLFSLVMFPDLLVARDEEGFLDRVFFLNTRSYSYRRK